MSRAVLALARIAAALPLDSSQLAAMAFALVLRRSW
jgi:hypothetical protein